MKKIIILPFIAFWLICIIANNRVFGQGDWFSSWTEGEITASAPPQSGNSTPPSEEAPVAEPFVIPLPTMGGLQYWSDEIYFQGWRVQYNSVLKQSRLLSPNASQYAIGTFEHCKERLKIIRQARKLPPMKGRAVILVHGFFSNYMFMENIAQGLRQTGRYDQVITAAYPTTLGAMESHGAWLERLIASLDGIETIDFVGHSMGGLVIRTYMSGKGNEQGIKPDTKRFGKVVFIATPNYGTYTAQYHYENTPLAKSVAGESLKQMGVGWKEFSQGLIAPPCPFGVIAGGTPDGKGRAAGLKGDNDGVVELSSTMLAGADDFKILPYSHTALLQKPETAEMVVTFMEKGYFISPEKISPLRKMP